MAYGTWNSHGIRMAAGKSRGKLFESPTQESEENKWVFCLAPRWSMMEPLGLHRT